MQLTLPNSLKTIEKGALCGLNKLNSITLPFIGSDAENSKSGKFSYIFDSVPASLRKVELTATPALLAGDFEGCSLIERITLPESIELIQAGAFRDLTSLVEITLAESNENYKIEGGNLYNKDGSILLRYVEKNEDLFEIPEGVKTIASYAFEDSALENVIFNEELQTLNSNAFVDCTQITELVLPLGLKEIKAGAFSGLSNLNSVALPFIGNKAEGATEIHFSHIFDNIPRSLTHVELTSSTAVVEGNFDDCTSLRSIAYVPALIK